LSRLKRTIEEHRQLESLNTPDFAVVVEPEILLAKFNLKLGELGPVLVVVGSMTSAASWTHI